MEKNEKKEVETKVEDKANKTEDKKDKKETVKTEHEKGSCCGVCGG